MRAFFDPARPFYAGVPAPQLERFINQRERDSYETWRVKSTGADAGSIFVDISESGLAGFLAWCEAFNIVRADVDRPSDFTAVLGRTPSTLATIQAWKSQPNLRARLMSLTPDEVGQAINSLSVEVFNASNDHIDGLRDSATRGHLDARSRLQQLEYDAQVGLAEAGIEMPAEANLDPAPAPVFQHDEAFYEEYGAVEKPLRFDPFSDF